MGNGEWYVEGNPRWPYDKYVRTYFVKPLRYESAMKNARFFAQDDRDISPHAYVDDHQIV